MVARAFRHFRELRIVPTREVACCVKVWSPGSAVRIILLRLMTSKEIIYLPSASAVSGVTGAKETSNNPTRLLTAASDNRSVVVRLYVWYTLNFQVTLHRECLEIRQCWICVWVLNDKCEASGMMVAGALHSHWCQSQAGCWQMADAKQMPRFFALDPFTHIDILADTTLTAL